MTGHTGDPAKAPEKGRPRSVLIADDHDLFCDMLKYFLESITPDIRVEAVGSLAEAAALITGGKQFDLILLDLNMPGMNGLSGLTRVVEQCPAIPVALISGTYRANDVRAAIRYGAAGFIPKTLPAQALRGALATILKGECFLPPNLPSHDSGSHAHGGQPTAATPLAQLTAREAEVFEQLLGGRSNKEIGQNLRISEMTVKTHLQNIFMKLGAKSRADAIRIGLSAQGH